MQSVCGDESENDLAKTIGGKNIIKCSGDIKQRININAEQLLSNEPDIIFVREVAMFKELKQNPKGFWSSLKAVKDGKVFYAPSSPSNWLMRPPSLMLGLGLPWAFSVVENAEKFARESIPREFGGNDKLWSCKSTSTNPPSQTRLIINQKIPKKTSPAYATCLINLPANGMARA